MQTIGADQLAQLRRARRGLEVDVAKRIGRHLLATRSEYIRTLILAMLDKILDLLQPGRSAQFGFPGGWAHDILLRQSKFGMWSIVRGGGPTEYGLRHVYDYVASWSTYEWLFVCSDVIRLFGEISEDARVKTLPLSVWQTMAHKGHLRRGVVYDQPKKPKLAQDKGKGYGHRDRDDREAGSIVRIDSPFMPLMRDRVEWRGAEKFKFGDLSVINIIDYTYGLQIEGGDVSGTTTDSIAALRWAGGGVEDPLTQLIAIATMVPQGHHTIVECAWPLTREGYMDYCIGFYETLVPGPGLYGSLRSSLEALHDDARNRHLFVTADGVCFHFDRPDEIKEYRKIAGIRRAYSMCMGGRTNVSGAANMMRAHHVNDAIVARMSQTFRAADAWWIRH
jgi:hypothetical protein